MKDDDDSKASLKEMISEALKKKKENKMTAKDIINKIQVIIKKKTLCDELQRELRYKMELNKANKSYLKQIVDIKNDIKQSKETMEIVCRRIKKEYKGFIQLINDYDHKVEVLKQKYEDDSRKYNEGIALKQKEQNDLNQLLNSSIAKTFNQENKLEEYMQIIRNHDKNLERDKDEYIAKENNMSKKILWLRENISKLNEFISVIQMPKQNKNDSMDISQKILYEEELIIKLKDKEIQQEYLEKELKNISFKLVKASANASLNANSTGSSTPVYSKMKNKRKVYISNNKKKYNSISMSDSKSGFNQKEI